MIINKLLIEDFLSIGRADLELSDAGLVLIQGINEDNPSAASNGAGKSSIVDAILWGLYGETARGIGTDAVIRHGAKSAGVHVQLFDEGRTINVIRRRQKGKGFLQVQIVEADGSTTDITLGTEKLTQEALVKAIGCSREVFAAAVCLGQEQMPDLPSLTDRKLKELIEEAAGVGVLEQAYAKARERCLDAEKKAVQQDSKLSVLQAKLDGLQNAISQMEVERDTWEDGRSDRAKSIEVRRNAGHEQRQEIVDSGRIFMPVAVPGIEEEIKRLNDQLDGFTNQQNAERLLQSALSKAETKAASKATVAKSLVQSVKDTETELTNIQAADHCDACGQSLPESAHKHACDVGRQAIGIARQRAVAALEELRAARQEVTEAQAALDAYRSSMSDPSKVQAQLWVLKERLADHHKAVAEIVAIDKQSMALSDDIKRVMIEPNPFAHMLNVKNAELKTAAGETEAAREALEQLQAEYETLKAVVQVFGPAGVRAHVLDQVTPYLNEQTSTYLDLLSEGTLKAAWSTLTKDAKGNLKEKFAIEVTHPMGEGFGALSGGEKRKVRIACALALQDLVASRASKPFRLWVCDEVDDALDDAGLERLMAVLQDKAREKGTVLVISHKDLRDWIPQSWVVTKRKGISSIEAL